jgi:predicted nucleotidyltransferase
MKYQELIENDSALQLYQTKLLKTEWGFFNKVVNAILQISPDTTEILLHGSRAIGEHKRTSDWDFIAFVPTTEQRIEFSIKGSAFDKLHHVDRRKTDIQAETIDSESMFVKIAREEGVVIWKA